MDGGLAFLTWILHKRTLAVLLVSQLAIVMALGANIACLAQNYISRAMIATGMTEQGLIVLETRRTDDAPSSSAELAQMLHRLRRIQSITSIAGINQIPFGFSNWSSTITTKPGAGGVDTPIYFGTGDLDDALGIRIVAGRRFSSADYVANSDWNSEPQPTVVLISSALATHLFGRSDAVGRSVFRGGLGPFTIVGIYERLVHPYLAGQHDPNISAIFPMSPPIRNSVQTFLLRSSAPPQTIIPELRAALAPEKAVLEVTFAAPFTTLRDRFFAPQWFSLRVLSIIGVAVLIVTLIGTYSTLSFWFKQRMPSLSILRALGVSRRQLTVQLQFENLVVCALAIVCGLPLAYLANRLVVTYMQADGLSPVVVVWVMVVPILIGQIAAGLVSKDIIRLSLTRPLKAEHGGG